MERTTCYTLARCTWRWWAVPNKIFLYCRSFLNDHLYSRFIAIFYFVLYQKRKRFKCINKNQFCRHDHSFSVNTKYFLVDVLQAKYLKENVIIRDDIKLIWNISQTRYTHSSVLSQVQTKYGTHCPTLLTAQHYKTLRRNCWIFNILLDLESCRNLPHSY